MSRAPIPEHTFYVECPICHRRLTARTLTVLEAKAKEHEGTCREQATERINDHKRKVAAADVQGDLFGGGSRKP